MITLNGRLQTLADYISGPFAVVNDHVKALVKEKQTACVKVLGTDDEYVNGSVTDNGYVEGSVTDNDLLYYSMVT